MIGWVGCTAHIIFYMADGSVITYDLTDPRVPLPSFRSLVLWKP